MTLVLAMSILVGCRGPQVSGTFPVSESSTEDPAPVIMTASEVKWEMLNPARGEASPRAATLWGDRNGKEATGFLVRFIDGFSSPPHIHNVSYRGVVMHGLVHNAEPLWMRTGSYWAQPKGDAHITSAKGETVAFIEIDEGPYLVRPTKDAFASGEYPVNVEASNLVWMDVGDIGGGGLKDAQPQLALLWGDALGDEPGGVLVKGRGMPFTLDGMGQRFRAVVIQGRAEHQGTDGKASLLAPGSFVGSDKAVRLSCEDDVCLLYVTKSVRFSVLVTK